MAAFYLVCLIALSVLMVLLLAEAVVKVSRAPEWTHRVTAHPMLVRQERRTQSLPFVGRDRRHSDALAVPEREQQTARPDDDAASARRSA